MKKVIVPAVFTAFVWFTMTEQSGFFNKLQNYVYSQNYYLAAAPAGQDCVTDFDGQYWISAGEYQPVSNQYKTAIHQAQTFSSYEKDEGELLFLVLEITEEYDKDGQDACAPGGNVYDHEIVMVPEGAMHPPIVLSLNPIECSCFIVNGGPYRGFQHEGTQGADYHLISNIYVTSKPDSTLTVSSSLR
ncbi:MAG: hypothetical protein ACYSR8_11545 [Planctomycetota bacterium]